MSILPRWLPGLPSSMDLSEQDKVGAGIVWEDPDTPANADDYIFKNGRRFVRPYFFEFVAHAKRRWAGKVIVDVFADEFKGRPREYYVQALQSGRIRVEGRRVAPSLVVRDSQKMSHFLHRHEPPVMADPVQILEYGPDVITVCKPPSVPVHPCGQYRKNTVVGILEAEHKTGQLFPIHRLDRLVSGLLILARNSQTANRFREEIEAGRVQKQYVAKVKGVFPADKVEVNAAVIYNPREGFSTVEQTGQPGGAGTGKESCTRFERLSTDGACSIVRCEPVTGRTHQIRVHLQHLGHPIANDHLYLQARPPKRSKEGVGADIAAKLARIGSVESSAAMADVDHIPRPAEMRNSDIGTVEGGKRLQNSGEFGAATVAGCSIQDVLLDPCKPLVNADGSSEGDGSVGHLSLESFSGGSKTGPVASLFQIPQEEGASDPPIGSEGESFALDDLCTHCPNLGPSGYEDAEDGLWLYCVRYASPSWAYECPLPAWAL